MENNKLNLTEPGKPLAFSNLKLPSATTLGRVTPVEGLTGQQQNYTPGEFDFTPKPNADNYKLRAQGQGWGEQLGKTVGNTIANIPLGILEGVGYIGTLMEFGDERDYSNALTEAMQKAHNPFGEVYRENPNQLIDWSDPAWWFNTAGGLVESIGEFAVLGGGVGGAISRAAKVAAWSSKSLKALNAIGQVASAATLSYVEGAMSGAQIFEKTYTNKYKEYLDLGMEGTEASETAKKDAAEAAARTVQLNTIMNTGLNMTIMAPLFKTERFSTNKWLRTEGARKEGESLSSWKQRLADANIENSALQKNLQLRENWQKYALEPLQEGIEEVNTQYAESQGGSKKSLLESLTDIEGYFKAVTNEEGALNFVLGAFGGLAHPFVMDRLPMTRMTLDENGNPVNTESKETKKQWVSTRTMNEKGLRQYFTSSKDAIIKDIERIESLNKDLIKATEDNDTIKAEEIRNELLATHHFNAVTMGQAAAWKEQFKQIASLDNTKSLAEGLKPMLNEVEEKLKQTQDPEVIKQLQQERDGILDKMVKLENVTEAMQKGYADHRQDNRYVERAQTSIRQLDTLQNMFDDLRAKYEPSIDSVMIDHLFWKNANVFLGREAIQKAETDLSVKKAQLPAIPSATIDAIERLRREAQTLNTVRESLENEVAQIQSNNEQQILSLIRKYKITSLPDEKVEAIAAKMKDKLQARIQEHNKRLAAVTDEYNQVKAVWEKDTDLNFEENYKRNSWLEESIAADDIVVRRQKIMQEIAEKELSDLMNIKNIRKFSDQLQKDRLKSEQLIAQQEFEKEIFKADEQVRKELQPVLKENRERAIIARRKGEIENVKKQLKATAKVIEDLTTLYKTAKKEKWSQNSIREITNSLKVAKEEYNGLKMLSSSLREDMIKTVAEPVQQTLPVQNEPAAPPPPTTYDAGTIPEEQWYAVSVKLISSAGAEDFLKYIKLHPSITPGVAASWYNKLHVINNEGKDVPKETMNNFVIPYVTSLIKHFKDNPADPDIIYFDVLEKMGPALRNAIQEFEKNKDFGSFDKFAEFVAPFTLLSPSDPNFLSKEILPRIAQIQINYVNYINSLNPVQEEDIKETAEVKTVVEEVSEDPDVNTILQSDSPVIYNRTLELEEDDTFLSNEQMRHSGAKNRTGNTVGYNTFPYAEVEKDNEYRFLRFSTVLEASLEKMNITPGAVNVDDEVMLIVDTKWDGTINYDDQLAEDEEGNRLQRKDNFQNYLTREGKIGMHTDPVHLRGAYANVPIKIHHIASNKTLGYLHRADWIDAKYPNAQNYRNVQDTYTDIETGEVVTGNVEAQLQMNLAIRKAVVDAYNNGNTTPIVTKVTKRFAGHVFVNQEIKQQKGKAKVKRGLAANLLVPDSRVQIAYVRSDVSGYTLYTGHQTKFEYPIANESLLEHLNGLPVTLLPTPSGKYIAAPLYSKQLKEHPGTLNTIVKAVELYLRVGTKAQTGADTKTINDIKTKTATDQFEGFDISTADGLRGFINTYYTHTTPFKDEDAINLGPKDVRTSKKGKAYTVETFLFDIGKEQAGNKGAIKIGVQFSGVAPIDIKLDNAGNLDPQAEAYLRSYLGNRFYGVQYGDGVKPGINTSMPINSVIIQKDGTVKHYKHANYNEYYKTRSETYVYGKHTGSDGKPVYTANAGIEFDFMPVLTASVPKPAPAAASQGEIDFTASLLNDSFDLASPLVPSSQPFIENGMEVTLELMRDLRNFTPEDKRNDLSPEEATKQLLQKGITILSPTHNPFLKC